MKDQTHQVSLPENINKLTDRHPDFSGPLSVNATSYKAAAWLSLTRKNVPFISLQLTDESQSPATLIKLAIWKTHNRKSDSDSHFDSIQEVDGENYQIKAWLVSDHAGNRVNLSFEPAPESYSLEEVAQALAETRKRVSDFLAALGSETKAQDKPKPAPARKTPASDDEEPNDIPFMTRIYKDVRQNRLNRRVF